MLGYSSKFSLVKTSESISWAYNYLANANCH